MSIPFDKIPIHFMDQNDEFIRNSGFLKCLSWFYHIDQELCDLKNLQFKFGSSSEFSEYFNKIFVRILLDVLFPVFRFSKASFYALTSLFIKFLDFVIILALRRTDGCHGNFVISQVKLEISLKFCAKIKE